METQLCELGLSPDQEQQLRIWNLADDILQGMASEPWWWVQPTVYHAVADWHDDGHPISFDQLVQELVLKT